MKGRTRKKNVYKNGSKKKRNGGSGHSKKDQKQVQKKEQLPPKIKKKNKKNGKNRNNHFLHENKKKEKWKASLVGEMDSGLATFKTSSNKTANPPKMWQGLLKQSETDRKTLKPETLAGNNSFLNRGRVNIIKPSHQTAKGAVAH